MINIFGRYEIRKVPLTYQFNGKQTPSGYFGLLRDPIPEHPDYELIGTPVSDDFEMIDAATAARLFDENVLRLDGSPAPIETMGILNRGSRVFITTQLPNYAVRGDEMTSYLLADFPLENNISYGVYTTGVRVVCQNTLWSGISAATQRLTLLSHRTGAQDILANWLKETYANALAAADMLKDAYTALAYKRIDTPAVKWIVETNYPLPKQPVEDAPNARTPYLERLRRWETQWLPHALRVRDAVYDLYDGQGTGMNSDAMKDDSRLCCRTASPKFLRAWLVLHHLTLVGRGGFQTRPCAAGELRTSRRRGATC